VRYWTQIVRYIKVDLMDEILKMWSASLWFRIWYNGRFL